MSLGLHDARNTARLAWQMINDGCVMQLTKSLQTVTNQLLLLTVCCFWFLFWFDQNIWSIYLPLRELWEQMPDKIFAVSSKWNCRIV